MFCDVEGIVVLELIDGWVVVLICEYFGVCFFVEVDWLLLVELVVDYD